MIHKTCGTEVKEYILERGRERPKIGHDKFGSVNTFKKQFIQVVKQVKCPSCKQVLNENLINSKSLKQYQKDLNYGS